MVEIDKIDEAIITLLQEDAKMNIKEISNRLSLTKTPVYKRIKKLEQEGVIKKYVAIIDEKKLENWTYVFCFVSLEAQKLPEINQFKEEIRKIPEVLECYLMGGADDFLLKLRVKDLDHYHQVSSGKLATLDNVSKIKSTFVLNEVKHPYL